MAPRSILIHGSGETAMSMLAVGFALQACREFAWAQCGEPARLRGSAMRDAWERYASVRRYGPIDPRELEVQPIRPETVDQVVNPINRDERNRLVGLLHLPPFLQGLVSAGPGASELLPILFSQLDALPAELVRATFADPQVHETLHRGGVLLLATFHGAPTASLRDAFDQVYRIEDVGRAHWTDAFVWSERGPADVDLLLPRPLREVWSELRLDPTLLSA